MILSYPHFKLTLTAQNVEMSQLLSSRRWDGMRLPLNSSRASGWLSLDEVGLCDGDGTSGLDSAGGKLKWEEEGMTE